MKPKPTQVYQFIVTLKEIEPPIWRRIQVPATYSFWDLHVAIQDAMGWQESHLHEFRITNPATTETETIGLPDEDAFEDDEPILPGWTLKIADYFSKANPMADYMYDLGDGWEHSVHLEKVLPAGEHARYPACLDGRRACPPEDCGGVGGFEEFLKAIADPEHEEHRSFLDWIGGSYDPDGFRPQDVKFDDPQERLKLVLETEI